MKRLFNKDNMKLWIMFIVTLIIAAVSYNYLPDQIPTNFDINGNVNRYGGKISIFLMPFVVIAMIVTAEVAKNVDPKKDSYKKFNKQYYLIFFLVSLLMLVIELYIIAFSFNKEIFNINIIMPFSVGLLFTIIGNAMPKFKQNFYAGIRTSWTLSDEEVWFKTHRLGGKVWFVGGLVMMATSIMPDNLKMIVFFTTVFALTLIPTIYSYLIYKNKN